MLKFPTRHEIFSNGTWRNACENNPGGLPIRMQRIVSPLECELNIEITRRWARKHSPTGASIMKLVSAKTSPTIHVIGWRGEGEDEGFTMFDSDSPIVGQGTVFINLDVFVRINETQGQTNKTRELNNFVVILHEFGHAKQFIECPSIFKSLASDTATEAGRSRTQASAEYDQRAKQLTESLRAQNKSLGYSAASSLVKRQLGLPPHQAFSSIVEWDNYQKHEGPICDEAGIMRRGFYNNIQSFFPSVVKW
jgi:hypothetical protein